MYFINSALKWDVYWTFSIGRFFKKKHKFIALVCID